MSRTQQNKSVFKVENMVFDFHYTPPLDSEFIGNADMTIPANVVKGFMSMHPNFTTYEDEGLTDWLAKSNEKEYTTGDTDFQILLMDHIINEHRGGVNLIYQGVNPYWVFHDICHAKKDVKNLVVCVDAEKEKNRLIEGAALAKKHGFSSCVDSELLNGIKKGYRKRWGLDFDIDLMTTKQWEELK